MLLRSWMDTVKERIALKRLEQWWELIGNCWEGESGNVEKVNLPVTFKTSVLSSWKDFSGK